MEMYKKITPDKKLHISFTFNPENYLYGDWRIMDDVNKEIVKNIVEHVTPEIQNKVLDFYLKNKSKIIKEAQKQFVEKLLDKFLEDERLE